MRQPIHIFFLLANFNGIWTHDRCADKHFMFLFLRTEKAAKISRGTLEPNLISFFYVWTIILRMFKRLKDWFWCCCTFQRNWSVRIWIWQKVAIFSYCVFRQIELPFVKMTTSWRREIIFSFHIRFWQNRQRSGSLLLLLFLPDRTFSLKGCSLKIRARVALIRISAEKNWTSQSFLVWTMERPL